MQLPCPQCGRMLEAPYPLPAQAKCPFCALVFTPTAPPPALLSPGSQNPYQAPTAPAGSAPATVSDAGEQATAPAIALLVVGILWTAFAGLNWISSIVQRQPPPLPPFLQGNPEFARNWELGAKAAPFVGIFLVSLGLLIALGALQMLRRRSFGLSITASILAMFPCSPCCILGLPFGIWALIVLNKPEVRSSFQ